MRQPWRGKRFDRWRRRLEGANMAFRTRWKSPHSREDRIGARFTAEGTVLHDGSPRVLQIEGIPLEAQL